MDHRRIKAQSLKEFRDKISRHLAGFSDVNLEIIEYRARLDPTPDGFPTNTRYGPRMGPGSTHLPECPNDEECNCPGVGTQSTSTEAAALRLIDGHRDRDPQQKACERIDLAFRSIWREIDAAEHAWDVILHASESIRTREAQSTLGTCQSCLRDDIPNVGSDRIRSGYCPSCYRAWVRSDTGSGRQDRAAFEKSRRQLHVVGGYGVDELDALVTSGTLPHQPKHAKPEPDEAV